MKSKIRFVVPAILTALVILVGIVYLQKNISNTEKSVKIVDYGFSICTQDVPSSSCGPYDVTVETASGQTTTYKVAGFDNRDSKLYYEITSKITQAKEQKTQVILKVNNKEEITSIQ